MKQEKKIVVVTGASRGLGRGIARQFGAFSATVYITGRPSGGDALDAAAAEIDAAGGHCIPVLLDHTDRAGVAAFVQRIRDESGRIDILVNNAAIAHPQLAAPLPFWKKPLEVGDMIEVGLHTNYIMAWTAVPLMLEQGSGLIANISFYGAVTPFHGPAYGAAKAGTDKMSFDMAAELHPHGVACVSIWPGFIFSDSVAGFTAVTPPDKLPPLLARDLHLFERPEFTGSVINALSEDGELMALSGQALIGAELGERYGITDSDGKQPRSHRAVMGSPLTFLPLNPERPMGGN